MPTILDILKIKKPTRWKGEQIPPAPGRSLSAAFDRDVRIDREDLWWLHEGNRAIRVGDWKLVTARGRPWELYDLRRDRAESHDLASNDPRR